MTDETLPPTLCGLNIYRNARAQDRTGIAISLFLPTRGRVTLAQRFLKSVCDTASDLSRIEVILYVDEDDRASHAIDCEALSLIRIIGPEAGMGFYNTCCMQQAGSDLFVLVNDDLVITSQAWDARLLAAVCAYPDGLFLVYPNDGFKGEKLSTFPILSRRCAEVLGDPYPQAYSGAFIDLHLFDVFKRLEYLGENRLCYLPEVLFEHWHYRTGKSEMDDTYRRRKRFEADATYLCLSPYRSVAARRLQAAIHHRPLPAYAEEATTACRDSLGPGKLISLILRYTLHDEGVPLAVRLRRSLWFCARLIAARFLPNA